ncbi:MAG: hypothetical protein BWK77_04010 [Verrucomicrobia bacterium A1]|nr:MAG: hypothetical protein BWK77_04010 [Verrucomicrobia bacterium A1]
MSRIYDELRGGGREQKRIEDLELFKFASVRKPETPPPVSLPPAPPAPPGIEPLGAAAGEPEEDRAVDVARSASPMVSELPPEPARPPVVPPSARTPYPAGQSPLLGVGRSMPRGRRRAPVILAVVLAVAGVVVAGWLLSGVVNRARRSKPPAAAVATGKPSPAPKAVVKSEVRPLTKSVAKAVAKPEVKPVAAQVPAAPVAVRTGSLDLNVAGVVVTAKNGENTVYFNSGVFGSTLELSPEGKTLLNRLAERMEPHAAGLLIKVVGCTDNIPVSKKGRFKDNRQLGLERANVVVKYLQEAGGLSAAAFATQSYGTQWTPYPNDSPVSRAKNRTVVLRVSMRPNPPSR